MKREIEHHDVKGAQQVGSYCFVCGKDNERGLHAHFFNLDDGKIMLEMDPDEMYQSFPDRMHGGLTSTLLDELMNRTMLAKDPDSVSVTLELTVKFRKPVPLDKKIRGLAWITKERSRTYDAVGQIILEDGSIAAEGFGRFAVTTQKNLGGEGCIEYYDDIWTDVPESIDI